MASLTTSIKLVGSKEEEMVATKFLCEGDKCWDERYWERGKGVPFKLSVKWIGVGLGLEAMTLRI